MDFQEPVCFQPFQMAKKDEESDYFALRNLNLKYICLKTPVLSILNKPPTFKY